MYSCGIPKRRKSRMWELADLPLGHKLSLVKPPAGNTRRMRITCLDEDCKILNNAQFLLPGRACLASFIEAQRNRARFRPTEI